MIGYTAKLLSGLFCVNDFDRRDQNGFRFGKLGFHG